MRDPDEGLEPDGTIRTGAHVGRVPGAFRPVVDGVVAAIEAAAPGASVYLYGSVATGQAVSPTSDLDLLVVGLDVVDAAEIADTHSARTAELCRGIELALASPADFEGDSDEAYGGRVFLHHYCVRLAGPDLDRATGGFAGDLRAARGFNGDIERHADRWRRASGADDPAVLGQRVARKTLLAVSGLVSAHDRIWTTDREFAARRWSEVHPDLAVSLGMLVDVSAGSVSVGRGEVLALLDGIVATVVRQFAAQIGLWPPDEQAG